MSTAIVTRAGTENGEIVRDEYGREKVELLKQTVCKGATDAELELFIHVCKRTGLDPFARQIHSVKRFQDGREVMTIQTGIDGYRLVADRTGRYAPGPEPKFEYDAEGNLVSATAFVRKQTADGTWHTVPATAHFEEYAGRRRDGTPNSMWAGKPHVMLSKCAEALALRRAFPADLSGVYTKEEMDQADNEGAAPQRQPRQQQVNLMDEATFLHHWHEIMDARGFSQERARKVLDDGLASKNMTLAALPLKSRHALLASARDGRFDDQLNDAADQEAAEPATPEAPAAQKPSASKSKQQPATGTDQTAFEIFKTAAIQIGAAKGVSGGDVLKGIGLLILAKKLKGKEASIGPEQIVEWQEAMEEDRFVWTNGTILPQQPVTAGS